MDEAAPPFPVAIVGLGCRFPGGAEDPERYWRLLIDGVDAIVDVPPARWDSRRFFDPDPEVAGKTRVRQAGFLHQALDHFDPLPFGISPREAEGLDPQQRLLLETAWEALEDAGQDLAALRGSATGVFVGGFCLDTHLIRLNPLNRELIDQHTAASATMTMLANRLSYIFDLRGPSLSLDTACSSSLVALHYACHSLWSGACELALAGGVNTMLIPDYFIAMSKAHLLSPLARCTAFDSRAAGYARGEGAGVVVLKPLPAALRDGDAIRAVILATGVNQDGRTNGITLPNPDAQAALIRGVYRRAGVAPGRVAYVEAHGTGTQAGDKAELETLAAVLGAERAPGNPCIVGAVKTNIGHLEAAAGMAGLIKAVLVLEHRRVPPNLHFREANPQIRWPDSARLRLATEALPLIAGDGEPLHAAVNSFGYGGTNAHVLLRAAPPALAPAATEVAGPFLLPLSACEPEALRGLAGRYAELLATPEPALADVLFSASRRRSHLPQRLAVVGDDRAALADALVRFAADGTSGGAVHSGEAQRRDRGPVFVYTGMGPQWWGMGRELARREPVFRQALEEVDALFAQRAGWSVLAALGSGEADSRVGETQVAQPANLALQVALTRLLGHWGVVPGAVVGHSIGEVAAAWSSGALDLADAVTVAWQRSRQQQTLAASGGGMLAVGMSVDGAVNLLRDFPDVAIAAINAPRSLTLSGPVAVLQTIGRELESYQVFQRPLRVEIAYHSPAMEAIRVPLLAGLAGLAPQAPRLRWYSTVIGGARENPPDADYWWQNVREPVRFHATIESMLADGHAEFVEVGPHPVLHAALREILHRRGGGWVAATLHHARPEVASLLGTAAALHVRGHELDWSAMTPAGRPLRLPTYPWQRRLCWRESRRSHEDRHGRPGAVWLQQTLPAPTPAWQVEIHRNFFPWLDEHRVGGRIVFPGAAYVAAALAVQREVHGEAQAAIEDLVFGDMLAIEPGRNRHLVSIADGDRVRIHSHGGEDDDGAWRQHAEGRIRLGRRPPAAAVDLALMLGRCPQGIDGDDYYRRLAAIGLDYGPAFRRIRKLHLGHDEALLELAGGDAADPLPPPLLDALFQGLFAPLAATGGEPRAMVPVAIGSVCVMAPPTPHLYAHVMIRSRAATEVLADLDLLADDGCRLASLRAVRCKALPQPTQRLRAEWFYGLEWQALAEPPPLPQTATAWLLIGDGLLPDALAGRLQASGQSAGRLSWPAGGLGEMRAAIYAALDGLPAVGPARVLAFLVEPAADEADEMRVRRSALAALALVQAAADAHQRGRQLNLCWITRQAQSPGAGHRLRDLAGAALWGLARVVATEVPGLGCRLVDFGDDAAAAEAEFLERHLSGPASGDEVAWRDGDVRQLRLVRSPAEIIDAPLPLAACRRTTSMVIDRGRDAGGMAHWREIADPLPAAGEVLVEVDAWLFSQAGSGLEWQGRIAASGEPVWGLGPLPLATRIAVDRSSALPIDDPANFPSSVLPLLFAWDCLASAGRLLPGETLLVHNAAGPLARALVSVGRRLGARLLVGAVGEAADEDWPEADARFDAGRLDYRDSVLACAGRGVDVLVVLAGGPPLADPRLLAAGGRLLAAPGALSPTLAPGALLAAGISLLPCAVDRFVGSPTASAAATAWLRQQLAAGWRPDVGAASCSAADPEAALVAARDAGLVRLDLAASDELPALPAERTVWGLRRAARYLISGGTSGFGLALAEWLAAQGVAELVLASRRGAVEAAERPRLERIERLGCRVTLAAVDVADTAAVAALCAGAVNGAAPLRGVFHCAMVLADAWFGDLDAAAMDRVLRPKVAGALNLHRQTRHLDLDCFVLFSSVSALIGNPGQAAYAAANACLDGLAHWRRGLGLPALSVNWGAIGDTGVAARQAGVLDHLHQAGVGSLDSAAALAALGCLLRTSLVQAAVFDLDWARWRRFAPLLPQRFQGLAEAATEDGDALGALRRELLPLAGEARRLLVVGQLRRQLANILRQREEQIATGQALGRLGLDSLLTLEWVLAIRAGWGIEVSAVELLKAGSLDELATALLPRIMP